MKLHSFFRSSTSHRLRIVLNPQGLVPALADVYPVPQVESPRRFGINLARWPLILAVDAACAGIDAFRLASPAVQPDAG